MAIDLQKIAELLQEETGYTWKSDSFGVYCDASLLASDNYDAKDILNKLFRSLRIPEPEEIDSSADTTEKGKFNVSARFTSNSMLFKLLERFKLSSEENQMVQLERRNLEKNNAQIACMLSKITGFPWSSDFNGVYYSVITDANKVFEIEKNLNDILKINELPLISNANIENPRAVDMPLGKVNFAVKFTSAVVLDKLLQQCPQASHFSQPEKWTIEDPQGDNYITSIVKDNDGYIINGTNSKDEPRSITIDKYGNATGHKGSADLGIVGRQMYHLFIHYRDMLLTHFHVEETPPAGFSSKFFKSAAVTSAEDTSSEDHNAKP